jgi:hypothetical protein
MSQRQLIDCLRVDSHCEVETATAWDIPNELSRRGDVNGLIEAYRSGDEGVRLGVMRALAQNRDPLVERFMHAVAFKDLGDGPDYEPQYWPLEYLAEECDEGALARLNRDANFDKGYPVASTAWARTIKYFLICNYRASTPHLILALNSMVLNVSMEAVEGLKKFLPGVCGKEVQNGPLEDTQRCYRDAARKAGYKLPPEPPPKARQ